MKTFNIIHFVCAPVFFATPTMFASCFANRQAESNKTNWSVS